MANKCYNRAETRRNSYSDPCSNAIYSTFFVWTYTILGIIRKGTSLRSVWHHCYLRAMYCTHLTRYYVMHSKFIIFSDNFAKRALKFTQLGRQLSRIWIHVSAKFHWCRYKDTVRFKYKTEFIWESYGSFRLFRGPFFKNLRDFWRSRF